MCDRILCGEVLGIKYNFLRDCLSDLNAFVCDDFGVVGLWPYCGSGACWSLSRTLSQVII